MSRPTAPTIQRLALNRSEVALAIGVSPNTIDAMVSEGFLPPPRRWHSRKVWLVSEITAAMLDWPEEGESNRRHGDGASGGKSWRAST